MSKRTWIRGALLGGAGLLVAAVVIGTAFVWPRRSAIRCLIDFSGAPSSDGVLLPGQSLVVGDEARLGFRTVLIQHPETTPAPVLVFVHGVAQHGLSDARILHAVDAFSGAGFTVVAPQVPLLVSPPDADRDEARLQTLLDSVEAGVIPGGKRGRFGMVGVSVGGALALRAAAGFQGTGLRSILAIGAPDDLKTLSKAWFALPRNNEGGRWTFESQRRHDGAFARNVIFRAAIPARIGDLADQVRTRAWLEGTSDPRSVPALTSDDARAFAALVTADPRDWQRERAALLEDAWPLMRPFSTAEVAKDLPRLAGVTVFLLHGSGDSLVPPSEYHRLRERLSAHTVVVGLESHMLGHVEVEDVSLAERVEHVVFIDDFFDAIR